jgi:hypothetical protein
MDAELHRRLLLRCRGRCECGACGATVPPGEVDHFFGRPPRAEETEATCWVLSVRCHYEKTRNHPSNAEWQRRFIEHCRPYGYFESLKRAEARLHFVETRGAFGSALAARR